MEQGDGILKADAFDLSTTQIKQTGYLGELAGEDNAHHQEILKIKEEEYVSPLYRHSLQRHHGF